MKNKLNRTRIYKEEMCRADYVLNYSINGFLMNLNG